ncbi:ELWxxDGT repeat protein [Archangium sp.]|uniref:ELWxxDGT repeat protein n=1 Tax=Archangium sp. TaxID=1872627 RepID=UPI00389A6B84
MGKWREVALLCSLAVGCGGAAAEEGAIQEDERPQVSSPAEGADDSLTAQWSLVEPGTARLVKDIFPPVASDLPPWYETSPSSLVEFRGKLFFAANFEDGRRELWRSDGTEAGTVRVKSFPPLPGSFFASSLTELTPVGTQLFFVVDDALHGQEVWVSEGTTASTRLVKDIGPGVTGASPYNLKAVGGRLLFFRYVLETATLPAHQELWRSDGTEAGTVLVKNLGPDSSLIFSQAIVGNTLYFVLSDPDHGTELWKSDGTGAGTGLVKDILPGADSSYPFNLRAVGSRVFFTATDAEHGNEVWRTDGTEAGTTLVADLKPGPESSNPQLLEPTGSCLYLALSEPDRTVGLYKLKDGTERVQVRRIATLPNPYDDEEAYGYITNSAIAGGKLYVVLALYGMGPAPRDTQLWVSDATSAGTKLLHHPLSLSDEFGSTLYSVGDRVVFSGYEANTGLEPWVSDGTEAGTRLLQDIASPGHSYPSGFTRVGSSKLFFVATDAAHGNELWMVPLAR